MIVGIAFIGSWVASVYMAVDYQIDKNEALQKELNLKCTYETVWKTDTKRETTAYCLKKKEAK